jgi:predicted aminopeptidase
MTHSTVWVTGDVEYNENFADFVGDIGAKLFLKKKFGENSKQLKEYVDNLADNEKFYQYMLKSTSELEKVYKNFDKNTPESTKARLKKQKIEEILDGFVNAGFANGDKIAKRIKKRKKLPNNAFFMNFRRYRAKQGNFQQEFEQKANSDLKKYIKILSNQ